MRAFRHRSEALFIVATRRFAFRFSLRFRRFAVRFASRCASLLALPPFRLRTACRLRARRVPSAFVRMRARLPFACAVLRWSDACRDACCPVRP